MLPPLRNGETGQLHDPKIEDKETRPPPRYNEGTLIEAMQNASRFVDDEVLRERLKEANRRKSLGPKTGPKVLTGQIRRGTGEEITAVLWASDLRGFTERSDSLAGTLVIAMLNVLFDAQAKGR